MPFIAVDEKKRTALGNYEPIISVSTKKTNDKSGNKSEGQWECVPQKYWIRSFNLSSLPNQPARVLD